MLAPRRDLEDREAPRERAAPFRSRLIVMTKLPVAGAVKTRLAREIGVAAATRFARHSATALLQRMARDPRWQTILAVSPDTSVASRAWPARIARMGQGQGDLGRRMQRIMGTWSAGARGNRRHRHSGPHPGPRCSAFALLGPPRCGARPGGRRRLLAGRLEAASAPAAGLWRRPLVEPSRAFRHAGQPRRSLSRLRRGSCDVDDARTFSSAATDFGRRVLPRRFPCPLPPSPLA